MESILRLYVYVYIYDEPQNTLTPLNEISHMSDSVQETKDVDAFNDSRAQKTFLLETTLKNKNKRPTILILSWNILKITTPLCSYF